MLQVLNYDDYISKPLRKKLAHTRLSSQNSPCSVSGSSATVDDELECDVQIAILSTSMTGIGPEQSDILQVQACFVLFIAINTVYARVSIKSWPRV
jgi:hypothetical protein